ncbi:MAG: aldo/keto reductase [Armatimonas sp.]
MSQFEFAEDRYSNDKLPSGWFRRCGRTGLQLPAISLGCWHNFGDPGTDAVRHTDEAAMHQSAKDMLFTAFDNGITHFDLANNYGPGPGAAETRVGRILKENFASYRDELVISTKAGYRMWPGPYGEWGSRKYLLTSLDSQPEAPTNRLRRHLLFPPIRPEHTAGRDHGRVGLRPFASGKAIYSAISNYSAEQTRRAIVLCDADGFIKPILHQPSYSLLNRWIRAGPLSHHLRRPRGRYHSVLPTITGTADG